MWRMGESERTGTAKADRARRSVRACCNGHRDAIPTKQKSIAGDGANNLVSLCAISAAPRLLGQRRARCVQSSCETQETFRRCPWASRLSTLAAKKSFTYRARTAVAPNYATLFP